MADSNKESDNDFNENQENSYKNITFLEYFYTKHIERPLARSFVSSLYQNTDFKEEQKTQDKILTRDEFIDSLSFSDWFDLYAPNIFSAKCLFLSSLSYSLIIDFCLFLLLPDRFFVKNDF